MNIRRAVIWIPDWPVYAAGASRTSASAVFNNGRILACTPPARHTGVRRGMRKRDAQSRCPQLHMFDYEPHRDARIFDETLALIESLSATVIAIRPGLCALRSPGRFYGGETYAGAVIAEHLVHHGQWDCRIGIADTVFAAEQAARRAPIQGTYAVEEDTTDFLRPLPIDALGDAELVDLLTRLGIRTLGAFADLSARDVSTRFGAIGTRLHRMASGAEMTPLAARTIPPELAETVQFEPPVGNSEQLAFSLRQPAERFVSRIADRGTVCSEVRIIIDADTDARSERVWLHPRWFTATDLLDRLRWQLQSGSLDSPASQVQFIPENIDELNDHADTLFGAASDEQVDRSIARVQGLIGHESVCSADIQGGRNPADRQLLGPWGQVPNHGRKNVTLPWPDSVPDPAPSRIYAEPVKAVMVSSRGEAVSVDGRGMINADPVRFRAEPSANWRSVAAWAGPWPVNERWWDRANARRMARFQIVGIDGSAWLMAVEDGQWWIEAGYD